MLPFFFLGATAQAHPPTLVFSIEEAFVNSPVQNRDTAGLRRVADTLAALAPRFPVAVTLVGSQADAGKLYAALDVFAAAHVPFFIDAWTSDSLGPPRPAAHPVNVPADQAHGISVPVGRLQAIRTRYGAAFAGIRLHEVFAANLSVAMFHQGEDWYPAKSRYFPAGEYFQPATLEGYFRFAHANGMKVIFSDPYWYAGGNHFLHLPAVQQQRNERELARVMRAYPGTGILLYSNNEPIKQGADPLHARIDSWPSLFPADAVAAAAGIGISDQAWLCDRIKTPETACPAEMVAAWAKEATRHGATWIEFEPYWYFFDFPRPAGDRNDYAAIPRRGTPTPAFHTLISALKTPE